MAEEEKKEEASAKPEEKKRDSKAFIEALFTNGNYLCTLPGAKLPDGSSLNVNDETRRRLALFSDGQFSVSSEHKFDGPVLNFQTIAMKKGLQMQPLYN